MCVLCNYCKSLKINFNKETEISLLVSRLPDTGNPETRKPELRELTLNMKFVQFLIHDAKYDSWQETLRYRHIHNHCGYCIVVVLSLESSLVVTAAAETVPLFELFSPHFPSFSTVYTNEVSLPSVLSPVFLT